MRTTIMVSALVLSFAGSEPTYAQAALTGYGAVTCRELRATFTSEQVLGVANWMSGYISGQNMAAAKTDAPQHLIVSYDQDEFTRIVFDACRDVPNERVVSVIDMLLETYL